MAVSFINAPDPGISSPSGSSNSHYDQNIFSRLAGEALGSLATSAVGVGLKRLFEPDYADLAKSQGLVPSDYKGALEAGPYTALGNQRNQLAVADMPNKQLNLTPQSFPFTKQVPRTDAQGKLVFDKEGRPGTDAVDSFGYFDPATGKGNEIPGIVTKVAPAAPFKAEDLPKGGNKVSAAEAHRIRNEGKKISEVQAWNEQSEGFNPDEAGKMGMNYDLIKAFKSQRGLDKKGPVRGQDNQIVAQRVFMVRQASEGRNVKPDDVDRYFGGMGNFNKAVEDYKVFRSTRGQ